MKRGQALSTASSPGTHEQIHGALSDALCHALYNNDDKIATNKVMHVAAEPFRTAVAIAHLSFRDYVSCYRQEELHAWPPDISCRRTT